MYIYIYICIYICIYIYIYIYAYIHTRGRPSPFRATSTRARPSAAGGDKLDRLGQRMMTAGVAFLA